MSFFSTGKVTILKNTLAGIADAIKSYCTSTDVHTILRLPTGIFYANGVKANVIFSDNKLSSKHPWTKEAWFYDYRINIQHTLKKNPLKPNDLQEFITCYNSPNRHKRVETYHALIILKENGGSLVMMRLLAVSKHF